MTWSLGGLLVGFAIVGALGINGPFALAIPIGLLVTAIGLENAPRRRRLPHPGVDELLPAGADPLAVVRDRALLAGSGVYLGVGRAGSWRYSRSERAVLLLGPPRSGKTSGVIVPTVIGHPGPVVSTSTKPDVLADTHAARLRFGRVWVFDPTGSSAATLPAGVSELRWSPVTCSAEWDGALLMARAMTAGVGSGTTDRSHWAKRAQALLAPMLHAAAINNLEMATVVEWVFGHDLDAAGVILEDPRASRLAFGSLLGIHHTEARERASIFSAAADALDAYNSQAALNAASDPNFNPAAFALSTDAVFVHAPAERQAAAAPIVCGLLAEIRRETYREHASGRLTSRMLFALDEVANIAPLDELPQIASEGGSQGLTLLAALQDLSQARARWGTAADGFLTLFGTKLILPGIADKQTLEAVSTALGEYDRQIVSQTRSGQLFPTAGSSTYTTTTQRTRVLSAGEIANIPAGQGLHLDGLAWELLQVTPAHACQPWRTLTERYNPTDTPSR
ncbi:MAG: type IV secretory system conjugative DNA transfer family protein [Solirubrobacteraceae bacterium]